MTNWRDYEAGLRQRGSLTIWFTDEAIAAWRAAPRTTPDGQARYSDLAIETTLILRTVFHQPLRQTEGLVGSLLGLMGLDLPVPDHSTLILLAIPRHQIHAAVGISAVSFEGRV